MVAALLRLIARGGAPLTRRLSGTRYFKLWGILQYPGRRSGRAYATPVVVRRFADGFVIPIPFGIGTQWPRNVMAAGGCRVRWDGGVHSTHDPEVIGWEEGSRAFYRVQRAILGWFRIRRFFRLRLRLVAS
jgi:deazaflavin-dependent oxidoreductase (nitroreductase family)